jgi:anti-anti-sigma factor
MTSHRDNPEGPEAPRLELGPLLTRVFRGGRTWFLGVTGPLDAVSVAGFRETVKGLLGEKCRSLVLDLRRVSYADSQGIRALLQLRDEMMQRRGRLRLVLPEGSRLRRALHLLQFDALFQIYSTPAEAWRSGQTKEPRKPPRRRSSTPSG